MSMAWVPGRLKRMKSISKWDRLLRKTDMRQPFRKHNPPLTKLTSMNFLNFTKRAFFAALMLLLSTSALQAQTDEDAIMMTKNNFCQRVTYSHRSWEQHWLG